MPDGVDIITGGDVEIVALSAQKRNVDDGEQVARIGWLSDA